MVKAETAVWVWSLAQELPHAAGRAKEEGGGGRGRGGEGGGGEGGKEKEKRKKKKKLGKDRFLAILEKLMLSKKGS